MKTRIQSYLLHLKGLSLDSKLIIAGVCIFAVSYAIREGKKRFQSVETAQTRISDKNENLSELIPSGYMLYPIEVINAASLHSMMGDFAYVNLYAPKKTQKGTKLIGKNLRIIRSPKDPEQFALVLKESTYLNQLQLQNKYYVTVTNPKDSDREVLIPEETRSGSRLSISYQN